MTNLTPQQRIAAYEWAAERIDAGAAYICNRLKEYYNRNHVGHLSSFYVQDVFIELSFFQPEDLGKTSSWFGSYSTKENKEVRLFILGSCILMAEEEISKQGKK